MFEKEAEEYRENKRHKSFRADVGTVQINYESYLNNLQGAFQDGAEFGYNFAKEEIDYLNKHWRSKEERKANEWHYVKDGDLPKENKICLLYLGSSFNPITGWIKDGIWYFEDGRKNGVWQIIVIAWKEIVFPEESE